MSNAVLEAAASSRPCIASDIAGCREAVENDVTGLLFKAGDVSGLIAGIKRFLSLPYTARRDMGIAGRAKVEKEFDREIVINRYIEEINGIIKRRGKDE
jgi:galacturonosyltransferase